MNILSKIAEEKVVENLVRKICPDAVEDLAQDIYLALLEKDYSFIEQLYDRDELNYYIVRLIKNNFFSSTSLYHKNYVKFAQHQNIDELEL